MTSTLLPRTARTYAIGDVHGQSWLLQRLLAGIADHAAGTPSRIILVGDYVDKGPDSPGVIAELMRLTGMPDPAVTCLMGNHDLAMAQAGSSQKAMDRWALMGGAEVLRQYGVSHPDHLPAEILDWLRRLPTFAQDSARYFVHAGLDPSRSIDDQSDEIRLSMRGDFLEKDHDFGKQIVHGHTPQMSGRPSFCLYRTNLDTGVYQTRILSAVAFEGDARQPFALLQSSPAGLRMEAISPLFYPTEAGA